MYNSNQERIYDNIMTAGWGNMFMSYLTIIYSLEMQVFMRDGMKHLPSQPRTKEVRNIPIFTIALEKTDMYANPYSSSEALQFPPTWRGERMEDTAKCKRFPQNICQNPHLYLQVISRGNQRISLGFVSSDASVFMWNADFSFGTGALPTTNDFWGNQDSLDPLSYRCVCIG